LRAPEAAHAAAIVPAWLLTVASIIQVLLAFANTFPHKDINHGTRLAGLRMLLTQKVADQYWSSDERK
jgi:hypothetical protein